MPDDAALRDAETIREWREYRTPVAPTVNDHSEWSEIFARPLPSSLPAAPVIAPVMVTRPTCPEHCSGRHGPDGVLVCRTCGGRKYVVVAHEYRWREGHNFYSVEPMNGAPPYDGQESMCCGALMTRGWG